MSELTCHSVTHYACDCMRGLLADTEADLQEARAELDAARTGHRAAVRVLSQTLGERDRLADERRAIIDCLNLYGDRVVHEALTAAGLLLDVATDDKRPWRNNDCPHGYGFDDCCHDPSECVATDDPPVPYRALEGSEGGEDGR